MGLKNCALTFILAFPSSRADKVKRGGNHSIAACTPDFRDLRPDFRGFRPDVRGFRPCFRDFEDLKSNGYRPDFEEFRSEGFQRFEIGFHGFRARDFRSDLKGFRPYSRDFTSDFTDFRDFRLGFRDFRSDFWTFVHRISEEVSMPTATAL